jgi:hypothetical protein
MPIRFMRSFLFNARACLLLFALFALPAAAQLAEGDAHWARRARGAHEVDAAIAAYERALAPNDLVAHARLLRAYRFKGAYIAKTAEEKKKVYSAAMTAGVKALALLARRGITTNLPERQAAELTKAIPGAADVLLWDSINWGEWALAYGKLAAARQGVAARIRWEATVVSLAAPSLEGGAAFRVLGRLHSQTPRIPFITGWASQKEAVRFLNEAKKIDPDSKITIVFLAEAMAENDAKTRPQAIKMLRDAIAAPNDPEFVTEEAAAAEDAKGLLRQWQASS